MEDHMTILSSNDLTECRAMSGFQRYAYRDAAFRIASTHLSAIRREIRRRRRELEGYIAGHPEFVTALEPVRLRPGAPETARRMQAAAVRVGVGPMAAVAGTMAQLAVEAARAAGAREAVVENGGDIFLDARAERIVALYAGDHPLSGKLALRVEAQSMPIAICSSSSFMGHSTSFGRCDLATVISKDAALADAAATLACNLVESVADVAGVLERIGALPGICGVLIIKADKVGLAGDLPELIRQRDPGFPRKITRHPGSDAAPQRHVFVSDTDRSFRSVTGDAESFGPPKNPPS